MENLNENELRLGNYFKLPNGAEYNGMIETVDSIYFDFDEGVLFITDYNISICFPILITDVWLLKFGFSVEDKQSGSITTDDYRVYRFDFLTWNTNHQLWWIDNHHSRSQPKYVHQLQNLYFTLAGKELKLKEIKL